ncbi:MAG: type IV pilus biogenesis/stability protein PilW [Gammaproteobacteria bacterium]|nr:type IV pilus biogenesis/stability protein PilW [Gammaproteobacteria bacterium]
MSQISRLIIGVIGFFLLVACQQGLSGKEEAQVAARQRAKTAQYQTQLGLAYLKRGERPLAKQKLLKALHLAPQSAEVNVAMAYFLEKTGDMARAKRYYQSALRLAPKSGAQRNNYGAFLCRTGEYKQGLPLLLQAGEDVHYPYSAMAYENAGLCAELAHLELKSMLYFKRAIAQDPARQVALYELVKLQLKHHDSRQALTTLQDHAAAVLNNPALLTVALNAAKAEENNEAIAEYTQHLHNIHIGDNHEQS